MRFSTATARSIVATFALVMPRMAAAQINGKDTTTIIRVVAAYALGQVHPDQRASVAVVDGVPGLTDEFLASLNMLRGRTTDRLARGNPGERNAALKSMLKYHDVWSVDSADLRGERPTVRLMVVNHVPTDSAGAACRFREVSRVVTLVRNGTTDWRVQSTRLAGTEEGACPP